MAITLKLRCIGREFSLILVWDISFQSVCLIYVEK